MEVLIPVFQQFGPFGGFFVIFGLGMWFAGKRLFNKEDGILTKLAERHMKHMDRNEEATKKIVEEIAALATSVKEYIQDSRAERQKTQEAIERNSKLIARTEKVLDDVERRLEGEGKAA